MAPWVLARRVCTEVRALRPWPITLEHTRARARVVWANTQRIVRARSRARTTQLLPLYRRWLGILRSADCRARTHRPQRWFDLHATAAPSARYSAQAVRARRYHTYTYYCTRSSHHGGRFSRCHRRGANRRPAPSPGSSTTADGHPAVLGSTLSRIPVRGRRFVSLRKSCDPVPRSLTHPHERSRHGVVDPYMTDEIADDDEDDDRSGAQQIEKRSIYNDILWWWWLMG